MWAWSIQGSAQTIDQGRLDLSGWEPGHGERLWLKGSWHFYPNEIRRPLDILVDFKEGRSPGFNQVPGSFLENADGAQDNQTLLGRGTYVLEVTGLDPQLALRIADFQAYTSARLYWFAEDIVMEPKPFLTAGFLGDDADSTQPNLEFRHSKNNLRSKSADLKYFMVVQIANYHHWWGGLWIPPVLGEAKAVERADKATDGKNLIILVALLLIALYNFSLYLQRREDRGSLFLSLFTIAVTLREIFATHVAFFWPDFHPWRFEIQWKFIFLTICWPATLYLGFVKAYYPKCVHKPMMITSYATSILLSLIVLALPTRIFSTLLPIFQIQVALFGLYIFYALARAYRSREFGARTALYGSLALLITLGSDLLQARGATFLPYNSIAFGVVIFVLFQSQIVGMRFARAFRQAERLSRDLQKEVDRQTRDIRSILTSINQGIFTIRSPNLVIGDDHSSYLNHIIGERNLAGRNVFEGFFNHTDLSGDKRDQVKTVLDFVTGEDELSFQSNAHCLPSQLVMHTPRGDKFLELDWNPIVDEKEIIDKILVCIRDVTRLRALEKEAAQNRQELAMLGQILAVDQAHFGRFINQTEMILQACERILGDKQLNTSNKVRELYINLHTLKGMSRTYQLDVLTETVHECESILTEVQRGDQEWHEEHIRTLLAEVVIRFQTYCDLNRDKLGRNENFDQVVISQKEWEDLVQHLHEISSHPEPRELDRRLRFCRSIVDRYYYNEAEEVFRELLIGIDSMARELGKDPPQIRIEAHDCGFTKEGAALIQKVMTHLLRNAVDHGIEEAAERVARGKTPEGLIEIHVEEHQGELYLEIWDDGRGLNMQRVRQLLQTRRLGEGTGDLDDETVAESIFKPGFTTKSEVNAISGRGVGMDAVRQFLEQAGGSIAIAFTDKKRGQDFRSFKFVIRIPQNLYGRMVEAS
jgi:signal transduction histidine kinase